METAMAQFEIGRCYFMLSFFDSNGQMPLVETYVFIGANLMDADQKTSGTTWYFKKPDSFIESDVRLDNVDHEDCIRVGEDTIELMLDMPQLLQQLREVRY
jgi:hypothetical protein